MYDLGKRLLDVGEVRHLEHQPGEGLGEVELAFELLEGSQVHQVRSEGARDLDRLRFFIHYVQEQKQYVLA